MRARSLRSDRQRSIALAAAPSFVSGAGTRGLLNYRRGQYNGARTDRPNTRGWRTHPQSADADSIGDLPTLRARARDAVRNMPLAASTLITFQACVIGTGLQPFPMIDTDFLGMTEEEGDAMESQIVRHWNAWAQSRWSSFNLGFTFAKQQRLQHTGRIVNGDHWVVVRRRKIPGTPYTLSLQHIEADLVSTPPDKLTASSVVDGVELDENGVAVAIWVSNHYPGDRTYAGSKAWSRVPVFADDDDRTRLVWHCVDPDRVAQTRGITRFAPGLDLLKGKSDWVDNYLTVALNSTIFTVLFKSPRGTSVVPGMVAIDPITRQPVVRQEAEDGASGPPLPPPLGSGLAISMYDNETIENIESKHPAPGFAPYNDAMTKEWAASTGLPEELITRKFGSNFSSSKGAINEGWKVLRMVRGTDIDDFCRPTYRMFVTDLVAAGLIDMPGFFTDPLRREAFLSQEWTGPVPGHLNPAQEATAAKTRLETFVSTHEEETAQYSGRSWEANHRQQAKEHRWQRLAELREPIGVSAGATGTVLLEDPDLEDDEDDDDDPPASPPGEETP